MQLTIVRKDGTSTDIGHARSSLQSIASNISYLSKRGFGSTFRPPIIAGSASSKKLSIFPVVEPCAGKDAQLSEHCFSAATASSQRMKQHLRRYAIGVFAKTQLASPHETSKRWLHRCRLHTFIHSGNQQGVMAPMMLNWISIDISGNDVAIE